MAADRSRTHPVVVLTLGVAVLAALAGCREDEQGKPLGYQQGVYQGGKMPAISESTRDALRQRAENQDY